MARCITLVVLVTYLVAVLQATLSARFTVLGVPADLPFVWTLCVGLLGGARAGALAGFGSGLIEGGLRQAEIGALAVGHGAVGFVAGVLATKMFRENWLVPVICAILLTLLNEAIVMLISRTSGWHQTGRVMGVRAICHGVMTPIAVMLARRAYSSLMGRRAKVS